MARQIPAESINRFRLIYLLIRDYERRTGRPCIDLSMGNPDSVPPPALLALQARFAARPEVQFHTYAEDGDLAGFAESMVELHGRIRPSEHPHLAVLPIPGVKTASALVPLACGLHLPDALRRGSFRLVTNRPAYDIIGTWHTSYLGAERIVWPLMSHDNMRLNLDRLEAALAQHGAGRADVIFVIRPGNPAAVGATRQEWQDLIGYCLDRGTRLVNDAAYTKLASEGHVPLAAVAAGYPSLEWLEMYSVSKSFSNPGARLGALVGSKDFVDDFRMIKGNTDSGPVPYIMAAYGAYLQDRVRAEASLAELRSMYEARVRYLTGQFQEVGFELACNTDAGFFTLWKVPRSVLGIDLATAPCTVDLPPAEAFNRTVIRETGIVGVHFEGVATDGTATPLIRYAACTDVLNPQFQAKFEKQLARLQPKYN